MQKGGKEMQQKKIAVVIQESPNVAQAGCLTYHALQNKNPLSLDGRGQG
jgi:hypothetical protein